MRVRVPCLTTRLSEELSLQQVRNLLPLGRLLLVLLELKALSLVLASTPTVSAGSVLGSERDSCSASSALVLACVRTVHYIWRINGAPQGTRRELLDVLQENCELSGFGGKCRSRIGRTSTYENAYGGILLLGRKVRVLYVEKYASRSNILLTTGTEPSRAEFLCTARSPLDFPCNIGNCAGICCLTHRVLRWFRLRFQDDACPLTSRLRRLDCGGSTSWSRSFARHNRGYLDCGTSYGGSCRPLLCSCDRWARANGSPAMTLLEEQNSGGDERTSAWGRASVCRLCDEERELSCRETVVCARCLGNGCTRRRVKWIVLDPASHLLGAGGGVIALLFRKWPVNLIAHLPVCPASVFIVLWKPLVSGDLDFVLISALAHNIRVLSLDRHASARATALSLAIMRLNITFPVWGWRPEGSLSPAEWPPCPPGVNSRSASVFIIKYLEMGL